MRASGRAPLRRDSRARRDYAAQRGIDIALSGISPSVAYRAQGISRSVAYRPRSTETAPFTRYANQRGIDIRLSGIFAMRASGSGAARADRDSLARAAPKLRRFRDYANQRGIDIRLSGIFAMRASGSGAARTDRDSLARAAPKLRRFRRYANQRGIDITLSGISSRGTKTAPFRDLQPAWRSISRSAALARAATKPRRYAVMPTIVASISRSVAYRPLTYSRRPPRWDMMRYERRAPSTEVLSRRSQSSSRWKLSGTLVEPAARKVPPPWREPTAFSARRPSWI